MDTKGAVDLSLNATALLGPGPLDDPTRDLLHKLSYTQWDLPPRVWVEAQLVRLAVASVIEARLLHLREERLGFFDLVKDPAKVTLRQLAALWRGHHGAAGQAFELAVVEAANRGVPEVVDPLVEALRLLDIHESRPPKMMLLGLEKVPAAHRDAAAANIVAILPEGAVLRTKQRGRPLSRQTVAARLTDARWSDMAAGGGPTDAAAADPAVGAESRPHAMGEGSHFTEQDQLARADALLYAGQVIVGVSMKINRQALMQGSSKYGWLNVPLWITRGPKSRFDTKVYHQPGAKVHMVVVELADNRWTRCFDTALLILEDVLSRVDRGHYARADAVNGIRMLGNNPTAQVTQRLVKQADQPIDSITRQLREVHPTVEQHLASRIMAAPLETTLPTLADSALLDAWHAHGEAGGIYKGPHHLFFQGDFHP